ncbi:hypothetical protein [Amycolatopsis sp. WAC 04197]|uniref:hypothetical protein n=1 Tax=Amycolatopsis sp. WAC 04197 TaxID=2203199 RepID=UPI000F7675E9|nr:hypothetical protein [Amycolatopsis sp. WAC 04197]
MTHESGTGHRAQLVDWLSKHIQLHRAFGRNADWPYGSIEELVLSLGRWGLPAPLPPGRARGPERMCYANAASYAESHDLTYVEGYALTYVGFVCAHAWCVDADGRVHDPTWRDDVGVAYLGIPFSAGYARTFTEKFGSACLLHDAHLDEFRILREGLPVDATVPIGEPIGTRAS